MGILVFGTLHTNSAAKTIDRVVDAFPEDEQAQARFSLCSPTRWPPSLRSNSFARQTATDERQSTNSCFAAAR